MFILTDRHLEKTQAQDGLNKMSLTGIQVLAAGLSVTAPTADIKIRGKQKILIADEKQKTVISIWEHFCKTL